MPYLTQNCFFPQIHLLCHALTGLTALSSLSFRDGVVEAVRERAEGAAAPSTVLEKARTQRGRLEKPTSAQARKAVGPVACELPRPPVYPDCIWCAGVCVVCVQGHAGAAASTMVLPMPGRVNSTPRRPRCADAGRLLRPHDVVLPEPGSQPDVGSRRQAPAHEPHKAGLQVCV